MFKRMTSGAVAAAALCASAAFAAEVYPQVADTSHASSAAVADYHRLVALSGE